MLNPKLLQYSLKCPLFGTETEPIPKMMNIAAAANSIARKFAANKRKAPNASVDLPADKHNPQVASGGTREVDIATPGSAGLMRELVIA